MNPPFRTLEQIRRELGDMAVAITHLHLMQFGPTTWQPPVNAFRCGNQFVICVELAGVDRAGIDVRAEPRRLTIRGTRVLAEPPCDEPPPLQVLALEIDHGAFERVLKLPAEIEPERVTAEHRNGLLWVRLPLRTQG